MFRSFKHSLVLLVAVMAAQLCPNSVQATTVSELLDAMQQRQLSIQDYEFVISRSFFDEVFDKHDIDVIVENQYERLRSELEPTTENMEELALVTEISRIARERSKFSGTLYQAKGIGAKTNSYAVYLVPDPQSRWFFNFLKMTHEEREQAEPDFYTTLKPTIEFIQHRIVLPDLVIDGHSSDNSRSKLQGGSFGLPPLSTVIIEDRHSDRYRHSWLPFWHEEALRYATVNNTTIVNESENEIELLIVPVDNPRNLSFVLFCNHEGRVHRFIKKSNGETLFEADYLHYIKISPEDIEIPQVGRMQFPKSSLDRIDPKPETTRISTILNARVNSGLTLGDLVIEAPEGTAIYDRRADREPGTTITTTRPVRLGADLPDDIRDLNQEEE